MSVAERIAGKRVVIVAGSGGVGKTTTSAAIALGLAAEGRRVAVVTIDPAKRLASALGLQQLGNEPHRVDPQRFTQAGVEVTGELWAMMLDPKRTFDELVERLAPDEKTQREILENRIYQELSGAVAGTQEFSAIAKLYELDRHGDYDVVVLDTPPSRNALDFLDAPDRLTSFFEGRALKLFLAPSGFAAKVVGRSTSVVFSVLKRVTGVDLLQDLSVFFGALAGIIDGFTERAAGVKALLGDPGTTFLIVTSPQREPVDEAIFLHGKLADARMPFGGLIVNRLTPSAQEDEVDVPSLTAALSDDLGGTLAGKVARTFAEAQALARRDLRAVARLQQELGVDDPILVPQLEGDVHDVGGLLGVRAHLFATDAARAEMMRAAAGVA